MNRIQQKFLELKRKNKKALIAYTMAGYPSFETTGRIILGQEASGVDIIELGVPFSDPILDGKTIQLAAQKALERNVTIDKILKFVLGLRKKTNIPVILMSYLNPIDCYPLDSFLKKASFSGVDGLIIPDLSFEESKAYISKIKNNGLDLIQFVSPTTSKFRMKKILDASMGFTYCISLTGVTGARKSLPGEVFKFLNGVKKIAEKPLALGIGISEPRQVNEIKHLVDGIIVGSAFVNIIHKGKNIINKTIYLSKILRKALG
ncbi:MAG: tryptophan synthase subunit alpha [bacterium]